MGFGSIARSITRPVRRVTKPARRVVKKLPVKKAAPLLAPTQLGGIAGGVYAKRNPTKALWLANPTNAMYVDKRTRPYAVAGTAAVLGSRAPAILNQIKKKKAPPSDETTDTIRAQGQPKNEKGGMAKLIVPAAVAVGGFLLFKGAL